MLGGQVSWGRGRLGVGVAVLLVGAMPALAGPPGAENPFLRDFLLRKFPMDLESDPSTRRLSYTVAPVSLDDKTAMVFVAVQAVGWCGSAGCPVLLLRDKGRSFELLDEWQLKYGLCVLPTRVNGWHQLAMRARGYDQPDFIAVESYDGINYSDNDRVESKPLSFPCELLPFSGPYVLYE